VRIFKYPRFNRFAAKEGITDTELREIPDQLEAGQADADLGGGVYIDAKEDFDLTDDQIEAWLKRGTLIEVQ